MTDEQLDAIERLHGIWLDIEWKWRGWDEFMPFYHWSMAQGYLPEFYLIRIDKGKSNSPGNCMWATGTPNSSGGGYLTVSRIKRIKESLVHSRNTHEVLAEMFGVSVKTIDKIRQGVWWRSTKPPAVKTFQFRTVADQVMEVVRGFGIQGRGYE